MRIPLSLTSRAIPTAALLLLAAACSGDSTSTDDASTPIDSSTGADNTTPPVDTGLPPVDSGTTPDTSVDETGTTTDANPPPPDTGTTETGGKASTFTEVYVIIGANCTGHHSGATPSGGLNMSTKAMAYQNLVGIDAAGPACGTSKLKRVVAGSAATSLLYEKISMANPPCGGRMPLNLPALPAIEQQTFQSWINGGALNN